MNTPYYASGGGLLTHLGQSVDRMGFPSMGPSSDPLAQQSRSFVAYQATTGFLIWRVLASVSCALSAYHGYRRNNSVGWAVGWGLLGGMFPVIVPAIAFAQGFGKPRAVSANRRRRSGGYKLPRRRRTSR